MNLESQVISLDLSKILKELGLKKKSIFLWEYYNEKCYAVKYSPFAIVGEYDGFKLYPAYTASELLEMLPACVDFKTDELFNFGLLNIEKHSAKNIQYRVHYECGTQSHEEACNSVFMRIFIKYYDEQLSNALAKTLIYLLKNNYVKAEDL